MSTNSDDHQECAPHRCYHTGNQLWGDVLGLAHKDQTHGDSNKRLRRGKAGHIDSEGFCEGGVVKGDGDRLADGSGKKPAPGAGWGGPFRDAPTISQATTVPVHRARVDTTSGGRSREAFLKKTADTPIRSEVRPAKTHPEIVLEVVAECPVLLIAGLARTMRVIPLRRRARPRTMRGVRGSPSAKVAKKAVTNGKLLATGMVRLGPIRRIAAFMNTREIPKWRAPARKTKNHVSVLSGRKAGRGRKAKVMKVTNKALRTVIVAVALGTATSRRAGLIQKLAPAQETAVTRANRMPIVWFTF